MTTIGGHPALDLCNTVAWRRDPARETERLTSPEALAEWYEGVARPGLAGLTVRDRRDAEVGGGAGGGAGGVGLAKGEAALRGVRELREDLVAVLRARVEGGGSASRVIGSLVEMGRVASRRARVRAELPLGWEVDVRTLDDVVTVLALAVDDLLRDGERLERISECQGDGCGWFFVDTSRNHSRRWCNSEDCGNRARVRAYVERKRQLEER